MTTPVSIHMLDAVKAQSELLWLVIEYAPKYTQEILGKQAVSQKNFWRTVRYRSALLSFDVNKQKNKRKYPYAWHIYYANPTVLVFSEKTYDSDKWEKCLSLDLGQEFYFQLLEDDKRRLISEFVRKSIESIQKKCNQHDL